MARLELIEAISAQLQALGLPVERGNGTDLSVHQQFLDAGWSTGNKTITYDNAILLVEQRRTVFMYEKTAEVGSGFSFGSSSESSVQSGKTLMRKVTSVQYGPEGQVYNVELDLGAIPKAVREAAAAQGWGFKTVIRKSKAMYSDGQAPVEVPQPVMAGAVAAGANPAPPPPPSGPPAVVPPPPAPPTGSPERRGGRGFLIAVIALAVLAALLLLLLKAGPVGWIVSIALIVGFFFVRRVLPPGTGGTVIASVLWVVTAVLVLIAGAVTAPSSEPATPAPAGTSAPTAAASPAAPSAPAGEPSASGFQLVSGSLTTDVNLKFDDAAGFDSTVVAVGHVDQDAADVDMRIAYSTDSGDTWAWGGALAKAGEQWPEAVMVEPQGAVIVGWQRTRTGDKTGPSQAFIAAATAPDFVPKEVPAPKEFAGRNVDLYDIANVDGTWVIVGSVATDAMRGAIWRSADEGGTWTKQELMNGREWLVPRRLVIGPDGSWNLIGAAGTPGAKFHAVWMRSIDKGATFTAVQPKAFASKTDEAALQLVLNDDGVAALLGATQSATGEYMNVLWVSNADGVMQRLDAANLPVQEGGNLNLGGLLFFNGELISYGSPKSMTYGPTVQFWKLNPDGIWVTGAKIESPATSYVNQIIIGGDTALALGLHDDGSGNDSIGVWRGALG